MGYWSPQGGFRSHFLGMLVHKEHSTFLCSSAKNNFMQGSYPARLRLRVCDTRITEGLPENEFRNSSGFHVPAVLSSGFFLDVQGAEMSSLAFSVVGLGA